MTQGPKHHKTEEDEQYSYGPDFGEAGYRLKFCRQGKYFQISINKPDNNLELEGEGE